VSCDVQFLGGTNVLTGHMDDHWKAVRKAVAPAFSAGNMRCATMCTSDLTTMFDVLHCISTMLVCTMRSASHAPRWKHTPITLEHA
jgi:hypothetical protein